MPYRRASPAKWPFQSQKSHRLVAWAEEFARERGLLLATYVYRVSAANIEARHDMVKMLQDLDKLSRRERPAYVLITANDRISRDMLDSGYLGEVLRDSKVAIFARTKNGTFDLNTFGRSLRMKSSWQERRAAGLPTSNKVPYGLQLRNHRDTPAGGGSAEWVRQIFVVVSRWYRNAHDSAAGNGGEDLTRFRRRGFEPEGRFAERSCSTLSPGATTFKALRQRDSA